ncbi:MAG: Ig-like domain-containing protein [Cocleimonas sp.]
MLKYSAFIFIVTLKSERFFTFFFRADYLLHSYNKGNKNKSIQTLTASISIIFLSFGLVACGSGGSGDESSNNKPLASAASITTDIEKNSTITLKGTDEDGDALTYSIVTQPTQGVLEGTAPNLTYKPNKNSNVATDSFTFKVNDGNDDSSASNIEITLIKNTKGILIAPLSAQASQKIIVNKTQGLKLKETCTDVPKGYTPLKTVTIGFLDSAGTLIKNTTTDECGIFSLTVPNNVVQVKVESSGNKDLTADVSVFLAQGGSGTASTIPVGSTYKISALQMTADKTAIFTVTDTVTNNAVIGIPSSALSLTINTVDDSINKLSSAANTPNPASITMILDASESMNTQKVGDDDKGNSYTLIRIATMAAHAYLDNMPSTDETGFIIFDSDVYFMNDDMISTLFTLTDLAGNAASYVFSEDGYSTEAKKLRFIVDTYYHRNSLYYKDFESFIEKHADTPDLQIPISEYPFYNATAIYDAIKEGVQKTASRTNNRKVIILMSDGEDVSSSITKAEAIELAKTESISIHTVAFGEGFNSQDLEDIANETNGSFTQVVGFDLLNIFQSIQTGIIFQYIADLNSATKKGDEVVLTLHYNGETATSEITR